jgi:hypothetical protein
VLGRQRATIEAPLTPFGPPPLIASGADVKVVQTRLRHATATTTLNGYGHLWPDSDESTRAGLSMRCSVSG